MRIVIVGPGALGSLLAARIALLLEKVQGAGPDNQTQSLSLLDYKPERAGQLRKAGLLYEEKGQQTRCSVQAEAAPETVTGCDVLFFCVKTTAFAETLNRIVPYLSPATMFVAMQNGISHLEAMSSLPCIGCAGVTSEGATLVVPGHVRHGGAGITRIGVLGPGAEDYSRRLSATADLLNASGLETYVTAHPLKHIWAKLLVNAAVNALTAIHDCPNGELLLAGETKDVMKRAVEEAVSVARAQGIEVEGDPVASAWKVCEMTAQNISSMLQDVRNRKPTEIDAINGAIVALGEKLGIDTPVNRELVRRVKEIETGFRL